MASPVAGAEDASAQPRISPTGSGRVAGVTGVRPLGPACWGVGASLCTAGSRPDQASRTAPALLRTRSNQCLRSCATTLPTSERFRSSRKLVWSAALVGNRRLSNRSNSPTCVSAACAAAGTAPRKRSANLPRRSVKPRLSASSRPRPAPPAAAASASAASWYSRSSRIRSGVPCAAFHKACSLSSSCLSDRPFSPATSLGLWMSQKRKKADLTVLPPLSD
mmetsp:Transcript_42378/g.113349  ORF Transcript_42378/g.113349 Transcript_42378/m.113349 type:complete len:221 (+) Transcript_42378:306-968(+)